MLRFDDKSDVCFKIGGAVGSMLLGCMVHRRWQQPLPPAVVAGHRRRAPWRASVFSRRTCRITLEAPGTSILQGFRRPWGIPSKQISASGRTMPQDRDWIEAPGIRGFHHQQRVAHRPRTTGGLARSRGANSQSLSSSSATRSITGQSVPPADPPLWQVEGATDQLHVIDRATI